MISFICRRRATKAPLPSSPDAPISQLLTHGGGHAHAAALEHGRVCHLALVRLEVVVHDLVLDLLALLLERLLVLLLLARRPGPLFDAHVVRDGVHTKYASACTWRRSTAA